MQSGQIAATKRLRSLDVTRGFAISGMVAANTARAIKQAFPGGEPYRTLLHARWEGAHFADIVFPLFLLFVGIAIALSMATQRDQPIPWRRLLRRTFTLIALGLVVNSISLLGSPSGTSLPLNGTLQRIGVVYFVAVLFFLRTSTAARMTACTAILLGYAAALEWLPFPGVGPANLMERNVNIAAWFDLLILGEARIPAGPDGIPIWSAGSLLSLPATAVIPILGTVAGDWIQRRREDPRRLILGLICVGAAAIVAGNLWAFAHPMIKQIWTASFVLYASGIGWVATAIFYWAIEQKQWGGPVLDALEIMGRNSITAYLVHVFAVIIATLALRGAYERLTGVLPPQIGAFAIIFAVLAMVFAPVWWLNRRGWIMRI